MDNQKETIQETGGKTENQPVKRRSRKGRRSARVLLFYAFFATLAVLFLIAALFRQGLRHRQEMEELTDDAARLQEMELALSEAEERSYDLETDNRKLKETNRVLSGAAETDQFRGMLRDLYQDGSSELKILKYFFPDQLVVTQGRGYLFFDILDSLKQHSLREENFSLGSDGWIRYEINGKDTALRGIDVSRYNGDIDWEETAASGVTFAYLRCGIRGYGTGKIVKDDTFDKNAEEAAAAGIQVGAYFFSQAVNEEEAREEAEFVLECVRGKNISCPIAFDLEEVSDSGSQVRTAGLTKEQNTKNTIAFCERLKKEGYTPIIYGNLRTFLIMTDMEQLEDYQKWYAGYISKDVIAPYFPYEFRIWQFSAKGSVPGISTPCDINLAFY